MAPNVKYRNIFEAVSNRVQSATTSLMTIGYLPPDIDPARVQVELPRDPTHGDMATNAAMVLAKDAGKKPRELAEAYASKLRDEGDLIAKVDVAGPGFINITLKPDAWIEALREARKLGLNYGRSYRGHGRKVNIEYVSANPTGPMHVGHGRGAVFGDVLANLLAFTGHKVTREYYVNDAGAQVDVLARSAYLRYREALGEDIGAIPEGLYPGDYLKPVGAALAEEYGDALTNQPEAEQLQIIRAKTIEMMMDSIRADLAALNITHEVFFSERSLTADGVDRVADTIRLLRKRKFVYEGRLDPPRGAAIEDWEDREQTLFRSTEFGDDVDRPLKKSDGSYTYFAADIAYHREKLKHRFRSLIDVWGADHAGYIKRMEAAVKALSGDKAKLDVKVVQLVKLMRAGQPVTMSKRAGELVKLRDVVDEVGHDAVRFMMLFRKNDAVLEFDLAKVIEQSRENPVFYVQYAHARGHSIFRNARDAFSDLPTDLSRLRPRATTLLKCLSEPAELNLMRNIARYPRIVEGADAAHEPHRIAFYLFDLASEFHALYTLGNTKPHLRFIIQNDRQLTVARLVLVQGVVTVLSSGLALLGVEAPNEMR
jgi:arginyl-tRNA synthetase